MNKSEIGMFYRYKGQIGKYKKITELDRYPSFTNNYLREAELILLNNAKFSFNIIDLIEVGDYVNGVQVIDKEIDNLNEKYLQCGVGDYVICTYNSNEIEDVVTKEQFSAMEYKVESEVK